MCSCRLLLHDAQGFERVARYLWFLRGILHRENGADFVKKVFVLLIYASSIFDMFALALYIFKTKQSYDIYY
jgi:hypothetical protein